MSKFDRLVLMTENAQGMTIADKIDMVLGDPSQPGMISSVLSHVQGAPVSLDVRQGIESDGLKALFADTAPTGAEPVATFWDVCAFALINISEARKAVTIGKKTYNVDLTGLRDYIKNTLGLTQR